MMELDDEEVNRGIAEFMGFYILTDELEECTECDNKWHIASYIDEKISPYKTTSPVYTESLDALVPVWEKLKEERGFCRFTICLDYKHNDGLITVWEMPMGNETTGKTIQQAAAYATYKAIKELSK